MNTFFNLIRSGIAWLIGCVLLLAAIGKLLDNRHFAEVLAQWQLFPHWSLLPLGVVASLAELVLAIWLFSGARLATAARRGEYRGQASFLDRANPFLQRGWQSILSCPCQDWMPDPSYARFFLPSLRGHLM